MNRAAMVWGLIPFAIIVCGCGQSSAPTPTAATHEPAADQPQGPIPAPDFSKTSDLALLADDGTRVHVGDDIQVFKTAFPRSAQSSRSVTDLPVGANPDHWSVTGWEFDNASRGVGALLYDGKVGLVMRQYDNVDDSFVANEVNRYKLLIAEAPQQVEGKHVHYWFWQDAPVTLMICSSTNDRKQTNLATAVGDTDVMAQLKMDLPSAQQDRTAAERMYGVDWGAKSVVHPG